MTSWSNAPLTTPPPAIPYPEPAGLPTTHACAIPIGSAITVSGLAEVLECIRPEPRFLPWRVTVAGWTPSLRREWAAVATTLEMGGLEWHQAERLATVEVARLLPDPEALLFGSSETAGGAA